MKPLGFEEQVFFTTVRIAVRCEDRTDDTIGTGFICRVPVANGTKQLILLVSNRHVLQNPKGKIQFAFTKRGADESPVIGETQTFSLENFHSSYFEHPNPAVDLACVNISGLTAPSQGLFFRNVELAMFCSFDEPELKPGKEVWFVGYPENRFDVKNNLPLLRRGFLASMPKIDYNGLEQLVIDAQVFPGSSGSPVFAALGSHFKLIGVVSQTMVKQGRLTSIPAGHSALGVQQVLGLGIVIKATALRELTNHVALRINAILTTADAVKASEQAA